MKSLKLFSIIAVLALLAAFVPAASAQVTFGNSNLNGKYLFQMQGVSNPWGYWTPAGCTNNCTFVVIQNGGQCPSGYNCGNNPGGKFTFGYIEVNGAGKITYLAFSSYNPENGGPQSGTGYGTYSISSTGNGQLNIVCSTCNNGGTGTVTLYINVAQLDVNNLAHAFILHEYPNNGNDLGDASSGMGFLQ